MLGCLITTNYITSVVFFFADSPAQNGAIWTRWGLVIEIAGNLAFEAWVRGVGSRSSTIESSRAVIS